MEINIYFHLNGYFINQNNYNYNYHNIICNNIYEIKR